MIGLHQGYGKGLIFLKKRLDVWIVENNLAESREKAKSMIMSGLVYVDNQKYDKPGEMISDTARIEIRGAALPYVSRGGLKLEKAMAQFALALDGCICMDIGASTGGFTDCMLQNGAAKVYAVDVGYGQLAWKLRCDNRVINMERTNARYLTRAQVPDEIDVTSIDVSFISLSKILPGIHALLKQSGAVLCLIKPQFEAGREKVGKKGVVRDPGTHREVIERVVREAVAFGYTAKALTFSPVKGPKGNIEYLAFLQKSEEPKSLITEEIISRVVLDSHRELDGDSI